MSGSGYETRSPARNTNGERPTTYASILVTPSPTSSTCRSYRPKHESRCCAGGNAAMKSTEQVARARLAPEPSDLARLVAGEHHNPHGILGAHEYGDHTVIRAFRPHATSVVALVGADRFPLQHIDSGLFAAALPFVNLIDYRLEVVYDGGGPQAAPTPTSSCRPWVKSTCICSTRGATNGCGRSLARIPVRSPPPTVWSTGCHRS